MNEQNNYEFDGYNELSYTPVPDEFFDWQMQDLGMAEIKVLLYIFRRTFGFKKHQDHIALSQFTDGICKRSGEKLDAGCGVSRKSVIAAIQTLLERGYIDAQMYCRCGRMIEAEEMEQELRTQNDNGTKHTYAANVVPDVCPACSQKLRGREERWFSLVVSSTGRNYTRVVKELHYPSVESKHTRNSIQETGDKINPADAEKTPEEELDSYFGSRGETPKPIEHRHWSERTRTETWRGWSDGHFSERDGVSVASQERIGALLEQHTDERPRSDGQWTGWSNTVIEIYKAANGNWEAIERGIATAAGYDEGFVPHIASRKGEVNGWANAVTRATADRPPPIDPAMAEHNRLRQRMENDIQYQTFDKGS